MLVFDLMRPEEQKQCAALAARAFLDYEYFSVFVRNARQRRAFLGSMMDVEFRLNSGRARYFTAKDDASRILAAAMLCAPDYAKPTDSEYLKAGYWRTLLAGGIRDALAWGEMEAAAIRPCRAQMDGGSWYLNLLTVEPEAEGRGIGSRMLREAILPYVREHGGAGLCLFTNSEINRAFYRKNGFEEFHSQRFSRRGRQIGSWSYRIAIH